MANEQRRMKLHDAHVQEYLTHIARLLKLEASQAFAEYRQLRKARNEEIAQSKRQREQARKALTQMQKQFALAEQNPVLARAIIAAFTGTPHDSWGKGLSQEPQEEHEAAVQREAAFSETVERIGQTIDALALPEHPGGRPPEPELDRLILHLSEIVIRRLGFGQTAPIAIAIIEKLMEQDQVPRATFSIETQLKPLAGHHHQTIPLTPAQTNALDKISAARQDCETEP